MKRTAILGLLVALAACAANAPVSRERIDEVVASPDRIAADRTNDARRHPRDLLAFVAPRPGMTVLDISSGGGYTTELLARLVAPTGRVYAQSPKPSPRLLERTKAPVPGNIVVAARPFDDPVPAEVPPNSLDLVTFMFNYHDLGPMGVDRAKLNRAVFSALKPGGAYVIADHSARPGAGISEAGTVHRIEEAFVRREVEAAGFRLSEVGDFLRNPADPRDQESPPHPKDEFVLKFVKP
jgi:predicted methyltransferase